MMSKVVVVIDVVSRKGKIDIVLNSIDRNVN